MNTPKQPKENNQNRAPEVIHCQILDEFGDVESAGTVLTSQEAYHWFEEHSCNFDAAIMNESGFTFQRPAPAEESEYADGWVDGSNYQIAIHQPEPDHDQDCTCDLCEERDKASLDAWVAAQEKYRADKAKQAKATPARKFMLMFCTPCDMEREHINAEGYWNCIACGQSTCASSEKPETHAEAERECDKLKEQLKTLLAACKGMAQAICDLEGSEVEYPRAIALAAAAQKGKAAIASVESEGK